jgi:hypothetical protein
MIGGWPWSQFSCIRMSCDRTISIVESARSLTEERRLP